MQRLGIPHFKKKPKLLISGELAFNIVKCTLDKDLHQVNNHGLLAT
jgi:hypothetical protein